MGFSPILNVPRMLQLGRLSGLSYPQAFQSTFMTGAGLKGYVQNTMIFAPGEGFRMMMCFGTKDFLMPKIGGSEDAHMEGHGTLNPTTSLVSSAANLPCSVQGKRTLRCYNLALAS
eukprot:886041-Pyramimonas_sp.AAC.1